MKIVGRLLSRLVPMSVIAAAVVSCFVLYRDFATTPEVVEVDTLTLLPDASENATEMLMLVSTELKSFSELEARTRIDIDPQMERLQALANYTASLVDQERKSIAEWRILGATMRLTACILVGALSVTALAALYSRGNLSHLAAGFLAESLGFHVAESNDALVVRGLRVLLFHLKAATNELDSVRQRIETDDSNWRQLSAVLQEASKRLSKGGVTALSPLRDRQGPFAKEWESIDVQWQAIERTKQDLVELETQFERLVREEVAIALEIELKKYAHCRAELDDLEKQRLHLQQERGALSAARADFERQQTQLAEAQRQLQSREQQLQRDSAEAENLLEKAVVSTEQNNVLLARIEAWAKQVGPDVFAALQKDSTVE